MDHHRVTCADAVGGEDGIGALPGQAFRAVQLQAHIIDDGVAAEDNGIRFRIQQYLAEVTEIVQIRAAKPLHGSFARHIRGLTGEQIIAQNAQQPGVGNGSEDRTGGVWSDVIGGKIEAKTFGGEVPGSLLLQVGLEAAGDGVGIVAVKLLGSFSQDLHKRLAQPVSRVTFLREDLAQSHYIAGEQIVVDAGVGHLGTDIPGEDGLGAQKAHYGLIDTGGSVEDLAVVFFPAFSVHIGLLGKIPDILVACGVGIHSLKKIQDDPLIDLGAAAVQHHILENVRVDHGAVLSKVGLGDQRQADADHIHRIPDNRLGAFLGRPGAFLGGRLRRLRQRPNAGHEQCQCYAKGQRQHRQNI